jgi:EmrB/QacA subfamily drug resistance transporter
MTSTPANPRVVALTMAGVFFILLLDSSILNTSLPRVASSMGVLPLAVSPTITGYLLASVAAMPLSGWLSERFGTRRLYVTAIALFTLASAACGMSTSLTQLIVARIIQGAAGGILLTVGRAIAIRGLHKSELLPITALLTWPALMAPVVGPPIGGWITTYLSWRWNFLINVPLGIVGIIAVMRVVSLDTAGARHPLDWRGALLTVVGLFGLFGGLELAAQAPERGRDAWWGALALVIVGAVLLLFAARHMARAAHPLLSLSPLKVKTFALSTFTGGTFSTLCLHATPYMLPLMYQLAFGGSAATAGAMLLPYFFGNLAVKSITTPLLRRFGFKRLLIVDGILAMVFICLCGTLGASTPWPLAAALLVVAGATRSTLFTSLNTLCFADVDNEQRAAASTLMSVSALLGQSLGIVVSTLVLAAAMAVHGRHSPDAADFRLAFFAIGAFGLLTIWRYAALHERAGAELSGHLKEQPEPIAEAEN